MKKLFLCLIVLLAGCASRSIPVRVFVYPDGIASSVKCYDGETVPGFKNVPVGTVGLVIKLKESACNNPFPKSSHIKNGIYSVELNGCYPLGVGWWGEKMNYITLTCIPKGCMEAIK